MMPKKELRKRDRISKDEGGAIEGLPLYLIIIIVITVVGLGIVLGLMNSISTPTTLGDVSITPDVIEVKDTDGDNTYTMTDQSITIKVFDSNNDPVKGAMVRLTGCNVENDGGTAYGTTDAKGSITFDKISGETIGKDTTHINVEIDKSGMGKKDLTITVVPVK